MTPLDLKKLRKLALVATKGPWRLDRSGEVVGPLQNGFCKIVVSQDGDTPFLDENAAYIAASNPSVVLELLDRLESYEEALKWYSLGGPVYDVFARKESPTFSTSESKRARDVLARFSAKEKEGGHDA